MENAAYGRLKEAARLYGRALRRYVGRPEFLFAGIELRGQAVLEIGCGDGATAVWASLCGAKSVVGLEPEAAGSTSGVGERCRRNIEQLGLTGHVVVLPCRFDELPQTFGLFDVVLMYNVVNHLDEEAVVYLSESDWARQRYIGHFRSIGQRMNPGGWLVMADSGRKNFWRAVGLPSPFARTIQWWKHQEPAVWASVITEAGFAVQDVRWSQHYPLYSLTGNRLFQYFTFSHFCIRARFMA